MINIIWAVFILVSIIYSFFTNNMRIINETILMSGKDALEMLLQIFPLLAVWLGLMKITTNSGLMQKLSKKISPILKYLFPDVPDNHESLGYIASNIVINMFGLGSAATPFGLKAMESLQEINDKKDTASRSMITFLVLNTSGVTIIPTTIISLRMMYKSTDPTKIVPACLIATAIATISGLLLDRFLARRNK